MGQRYSAELSSTCWLSILEALILCHLYISQYFHNHRKKKRSTETHHHSSMHPLQSDTCPHSTNLNKLCSQALFRREMQLFCVSRREGPTWNLSSTNNYLVFNWNISWELMVWKALRTDREFDIYVHLFSFVLIHSSGSYLWRACRALCIPKEGPELVSSQHLSPTLPYAHCPIARENKVPSPKAESEHQLVLDFKDGLDLTKRRVDRLPFRNKLTF